MDLHGELCPYLCVHEHLCVCLHKRVHGQAGDAYSGVIQEKK